MKREAVMHGSYENFAVDRIIYGRPVAEVLAAEAARIGARHVFMLVSRTLDRETDWVDTLRSALGERYAGSYDGMPPHTPRDAVLHATSAARSAGADLIVSFGGGSLTDAAKMVRLALQHDIRSIDDFDRFVVRVQPDGSRIAPDYAPPEIGQITIPTTLSGGDFNPPAGCTDPRTMLKEIYRHPRLMPRVIVLDPAVTLRTPMWLWLSTGIRALDHAVETICADAADPRSWLESLHAVQLLHSALPRTKANPSDLSARLDAQLAMWLATEHNRFAISMGASHGIGHVLGGTCNVPHGYTSCVMLPAVLRWNEVANAARQKLVAEAMGVPDQPAWQALDIFIAGLGLPRTLAAVGVTDAQFATVARAAMLDHYLHRNPRPVRGEADVLEILRLAA
jgi:maleylacetate reductase